MRDPAAEVGGDLVADVAERPVRIGRAGQVVLDDRPPLGLVGVEQRGGGPAAEHPRQLPTEVERVGDGGVHPGAAARRHAVRGIADEERVPDPERVGDHRRERRRPDALDQRLELGDAGREPEQPRDPLRRVLVEPLAGRVPPDAEDPAVAASGRQQAAARLRMLDPVDAEAVRADDIPQRRAEQRRHAFVEMVRAAHGDAERGAHGAVHTVGRDHVPRPDRPAGVRVRVAQDRRHPVGPVVERDQLDAALDPCRRPPAEMVGKDGLEVVLGDARGRGRAEHLALAAAGQADRVADAVRSVARASRRTTCATRPRRRRPAPCPRGPTTGRAPSVRRLTPVARGSADGSGRRSTRRTGTP